MLRMLRMLRNATKPAGWLKLQILCQKYIIRRCWCYHQQPLLVNKQVLWYQEEGEKPKIHICSEKVVGDNTNNGIKSLSC